MAAIYINSMSGSDSLGSGTNSSPFKSMARGILQALPGDIVVITGPMNHVHQEPDQVLISDKLNIKIQIEPLRNILVQPLSDTAESAIKIVNSNGISVSGLRFVNAPGNHAQAHAILIINSVNCKILGCEIDSAWKSGDVPATELFKCVNSSVELTGNFCNYVENSYPTLMNPDNFLSFISVSGNGEYLVRNCAIKNVHSNSGYAYGIKIYPDTRKVIISDFEASDFVAEHVDYKDKMIGIYISSDNSAVQYEINNVILHNLGYGICLDNAIEHNANHIKRALIYDCLYAAVHLKNNSVLRSSRNFTIVNCLHGIQATNRSVGEFYNVILYKNSIALRSEIDSNLKLSYSVYYLNNTFKFENNRSIINNSQFVRNIDPKFVNETELNFRLTDYSPCVDTGKYFVGDSYLGNGPDMGYFEKSALVTEQDLPSLLAKTARRSELVPLTEIDIIGMVSKGIETSDGRIIASREGSAVKDVAVKPLDMLIAPYHTELELIRERLSFDRLENLSEEDADLLASNVFVKRNKGSVASGILRVYFATPTDAILYAEHEFKAFGNLKFYTRATVTITKDEMALNYDNGAYYLDSVIDAEFTGSEYDIPAFSVNTSTMPMPPGTLNFTNPYDMTGGTRMENNYELKEKAKYSISVRDIVTKKGARATMPDLFPIITDMRVIGYRDPEMERDYISLISDHIGGKTDIYIKTRNLITDSKIIYPEGKFFEITDASFSGFVPLIKVVSIEILEPVTENETGIFLDAAAAYKIHSRDSWHRFSVKEHLAIEFSDSIIADYIPATPFKVTFQWIPEMKAIQSVVDGDDERVVVADILVKAFEPVFVSFNMAYNAPQEIPDLSVILSAGIRALEPGKELQESDLVELAYRAGVSKVLQPMEIFAEHHKRNGEVVRVSSPDGIIMPRISTYWESDIQVTYLGPEK